MCKSLNIEQLREAVKGSAAAFRCVTEYQPAGGPGEKVFPPTYEGGKYATEKRCVPGRDGPVNCVLLDSVQSQANRMELALLDAWEARRIELPVIVVEFSDNRLEKRLRVTSLDAPHRIADAILRDSYDGNGDGRKLFRQSERGKRLDHVDLRNATALLEMCPTALVFGMWDSTGPKGGLGAKFQRALVSEIVGYDAVPGVKTSSRIDPLGIQKDEQTTIFASSSPLGWTLDEKSARTDDKKKPLRLGDGKPSEINHGNITPSPTFERDQNGNVVLYRERVHEHMEFDPAMNQWRHFGGGGVTISKAVQTTTLSLPALRRLHFPPQPGEAASQEVNDAARTALAALALCAATFAREAGCDLRSRCLLVPKEGEQFIWELIGVGRIEKLTLTSNVAIALLSKAVTALRRKIKAAWPKEPVNLTPSNELLELVVRSQRLAAAGKGEVAESEG